MNKGLISRPPGTLALALAIAIVPAFSLAASLGSGDTNLVVDGQKISISRKGNTVIQLNAIEYNYQKATSWSISSTEEDRIVLRGEFPASVDFYRHVQDLDDRVLELVISREPGGFRLFAHPDWGRQVTLEFAYLGDHFFGLSEPLQPDNRLSPDLTETSITVDIASEGAALQENYASAYSAFYMSTYGYGAFFDTFARGRYDFAINRMNRIHHDTGTLDWHILFGDDGREIHRAYFALIGKPRSVPAWGLGPVGWRDQNDGGAAEILADVEKLSAIKIPFTSWFVDRPYSDGAHAWSGMNFSEAFANAAEWIKTLRDDYGLEFMTWVSPATFGDTRFDKHLDGRLTYIDLSHPETVSEYQAALRSQHAKGIKGHKIDRGDEAFPEHEYWHDEGVQSAEKRNKYAYLMAKVHDDVLRESWGDDQFTFARSAFHRTQPYLSAIWGGDPRTSWEGLQGNFANAARSAFMGFPVWGSDVGGYQGEGYIPEDIYLRWMQAGSMSGLFEIKLDGAGGEGRDRMPWRYDTDFQDVFRSICEDRMRFIPYLYSLSSTSAENGTTMQPLAYRHFDDSNTYNVWDQFYVGDAIMVAPVFTPGTERRVYFPKGKWRDLDNPAVSYDGGTTVDLEVPLDSLPRFVKQNSLYVSGSIYQGNNRTWNEPDKQLSIHAYPGRNGERAEFTYVDLLDNDSAKAITMVVDRRQVRISSPAMLHPTRILVLLEEQPKAVRLNGRTVELNYDEGMDTLSVIAVENSGIDLKIEL
jgi:alpha-glucosidase (family GH31 glycosyl hydrolase)